MIGKMRKGVVYHLSKLKKNFVYVFIQQFILIGLPFLTIPYVSRVLGPDGVGLYSYSFSIVTITINVFLLGSNLYATREIAKVKDNESDLAKVFSEIVYIRIALLGIASLLYLLMCWILFPNELIFYLQIIHLLATFFDITWLFQGVEDFKKVVIRNVLVKLLGFGTIFIFVKNPEDILIYTVIMGLSVFVGNGLLFYKLRETVTFTKISSFVNIKKHLNQMLILFIPAFSALIYSILDKTMIGALAGTEQVGYYEQSYKIVFMLTSIMNVTGIVMLPRTSSLIAKGQMDKLHSVLMQGIRAILLISIPLSAGLILISNEFVTWFLGKAFEPSVIICMVMAPIILFKALGVVLGSWYLVPMGLNKQYTIPIVAGAVLNVMLNFMLIPYYGALGAAISTVSTEGLIVIVQLWLLRKVFDVKVSVFKNFLKYSTFALIMYGAVFYFISVIGELPDLITILLKITAGIMIYIVLLFITKDEPFRWLISKLKNK